MFQIYEVVMAKHSLANVPKGTLGTILIIHDETHFIVEFMSGNESLAVITVSADDIEKVQQ